MKLPPARATAWSLLGAQYLLPAATVVKIPMVPQLDKNTIPSLCALVALLILRKSSKRNPILAVDILIFAYVLSPLATSLANGDVIVAGGAVLPGVGVYDGVSASLLALLGVAPLLLGRYLLGNAYAIREAFKALLWCGLIYSPFMLFEMKMSPQLHAWVYGFVPSDLIQQIRGEGFRPMVFMGHGLIASFFAMLSFLTTTALKRTEIRGSRLFDYSIIYLGGLLLLCKSLGAIIYGAFAFPLIRWASPRSLNLASTLLVCFALLFPLLRYSNIFPTTELLSAFEQLSPERAKSLAFRFNNEDLLLNKAAERWLLGWGRYGRSRIYSEYDGKDIAVTDGRWIIDFGQYGLLGFSAEFGLLIVSVLAAARWRAAAIVHSERLLVSIAALILAINVIELIPNSTLTPWTMLLAGMLVGMTEAKRSNSQTDARPFPKNATPAAKSFKGQPA
ncbi:hypothetical protein JQ580_32560 [Bradyrhizobium japonicum]|uniref:hypothetical protein n=1 Tax=Bradyrhizobium japonicum TaxID=375 RepID=UPI001BAA80F1|nr:hypothetical protein [Bradyrhizobium japonicum]MBR0995455.1 hypothetical protein [Bradyrhizobium japonicum]